MRSSRAVSASVDEESPVNGPQETLVQAARTAAGIEPGPALQPVPAAERIEVIDALRGFALAGVLFANLFAFSGYLFLPEEQQATLPGGAVNGIVHMLANVFVNGKFITIFSLLFGLGFGIQLARARARGVDVVPTYARRLLVLLAIGLVHKFVLWGGDILTLYALFGFGLLLVRDWPARRLLAGGLIVALAALPIAALLKVVTGAPLVALPPGWDTEMVRAMAAGSWAEVFRLNAEYEVYRHIHDSIPYIGIFGAFLVGYWTARAGLLHDVIAHRRLLRRVCGWGFMPGPGWSGRVGPAGLVPIASVVFGAQIAFSAWWLRQYRFGPVEWLWRSLTYGHLQPIRRVESARAVALG
jgi:uncharacterized protein